MRFEFAKTVLEKLLKNGPLERSHRLLAVCAGAAERELFMQLGFSDVTLSNLDNRMSADAFAPLRYSREDAQQLSFDAQSFDFVFVSDGLHHCSSPHRALLEMYRVAKHGVIVIESRDNSVMRLATCLGLASDHEVAAVRANDCEYGGVDNSAIPNFIYRWTEREFEKTVATNNPTGAHEFYYHYGLHLPYRRANWKRNPSKWLVMHGLGSVLRLFFVFFKKQGNSFAMIAIRPKTEKLWPWLQLRDGEVVFNRDYS